jgi:hypothetical protein
MLTEALGVTMLVGNVLDELGVPWLVGGSIASSLQGVPRATQDVDLVAALQRVHVRPFSEALEAGFYVSEDAIWMQFVVVPAST